MGAQTAASIPHPQDFSADVGDPVLLQGAALGVLHQVRH